MFKKNFLIDLGMGDIANVIQTRNEEFTLADFIEEVKNSGEWYISRDTAIQVSHIKRITERY